jgi:hypothetical protein
MEENSETPPGALGEVFTAIEVSHVIIRACTVCGGSRTIGDPCGSCGNLQPPIIHDLGVTSGVYKDTGLQGLWDRVGKLAADRRIQRANSEARLLQRIDLPSSGSASADTDI